VTCVHVDTLIVVHYVVHCGYCCYYSLLWGYLLCCYCLVCCLETRVYCFCDLRISRDERDLARLGEAAAGAGMPSPQPDPWRGGLASMYCLKLTLTSRSCHSRSSTRSSIACAFNTTPRDL
jgi:hypothetical protein